MKDHNYFIKTFLFFTGLGMLVSSIIYAIHPIDDRWFTRTALFIICFGFLGIIRAIENIKK